MQSLKFYSRNDLMFIDIVNGIFQFLEYNYLYVSFKMFVKIYLFCMFEYVYDLNVYLFIYLECLWICLELNVYLSICLNTCVLWIYLFVTSLSILLWNMDLVLVFDALMSTLINFCSFSTMIINDFCKWAWIFKVVMAMYISKFDVYFWCYSSWILF